MYILTSEQDKPNLMEEKNKEKKKSYKKELYFARGAYYNIYLLTFFIFNNDLGISIIYITYTQFL